MTGLPPEPLEDSRRELWAVVVTYKRPQALSFLLEKLQAQTRGVDRLIVIDNGSDPAVRRLVGEFEAIYIDPGENLGPAGAIALGMTHVLQFASPDDWLILFDDDDPPRADWLLSHLWLFAKAQLRIDPQTAGVGLVGARYDHRWGITRRVPDRELVGSVAVDYIGGGQFPIFLCSALSDVGVFDRELFFGLDDLEHGLRLRRAGYSLYVDGDLWLRERQRHGRTGLDGRRIRTREDIASWRLYYSARNAILVAKRNASPAAAMIVSLGLAVKGSMSLLSARGSAQHRILPLRGVMDGVLGRTGRRVDPGLAEKTR